MNKQINKENGEKKKKRIKKSAHLHQLKNAVEDNQASILLAPFQP